MSRLRWSVVSSFLLLLPGLLYVSSAQGQWMTKPPPADSPYWWTLTDCITPAEMRKSLQSRQENQERLRQAIEAGEYPQLPESRIREISLFIDGSRDPELFPMWHAFGDFAFNLNLEENWEEQAREALVLYGISAEGIENVVTTGFNYWDFRGKVIEELGSEPREFADKVLGPVERKLGRRSTADVIVRQDIDRLARETGIERHKLSRLYESWLRDPAAEAGVESLENLRPSLTEEDWEGLRRYLLEEFAKRNDYDYFDERPLR